MRIPIPSIWISSTLLVIIMTSAFSSLAQDNDELDSLTKNASEQNQDERVVPKGDEVHTLSQGIGFASFGKGGEKEKQLEDFIKEQKVAGFLVLHDGKIRLERYALGHSQSNRWSSLSVAKSITSTLVGAAIKDGYIKTVDDYVTTYLPDLKGSAYDSVKIRHLLTMTTGIRWNENYVDSNADLARLSSDPLEPGVNATVSYMRRLPAVAAPGKKFTYSTGETHLLGALLSAAIHETLSHYLSTKIWIPYGMEANATWRLDRTGLEMAGCCLQMTLRDFGRFGQFVLDGATIQGNSIVPTDWFEAATKTQVPLWPGGGYGYGWWKFNGSAFEALGIYGQMIHIDPSRNLVIAINSAWPEAESNERHLAVANFIKSIETEIDKERKSTSAEKVN